MNEYKELEKYSEYLEAAEPTFDETFIAYVNEFAAKTVAFYTPKLFTPEQGPEVEKVLYLAALFGAHKYTLHECKKLAADIRAGRAKDADDAAALRAELERTGKTPPPVDNNAVHGDTEAKK